LDVVSNTTNALTPMLVTKGIKPGRLSVTFTCWAFSFSELNLSKSPQKMMKSYFLTTSKQHSGMYSLTSQSCWTMLDVHIYPRLTTNHIAACPG